MTEKGSAESRDFHETSIGRIVRGDSIDVLASCEDASVDLIMTSPPFGLVRKKDYGNVEADEYVEWFRSFAVEFRRVLKDNGSLVIDIGGAWNKGRPTRRRGACRRVPGTGQSVVWCRVSCGGLRCGLNSCGRNVYITRRLLCLPRITTVHE